jgi:FolB domain-containing protein
MVDVIVIHGLEVHCIVGIRPSERIEPQCVRLDVHLRLGLGKAGRTGRIAHTIDYDRVAQQIEALLQFRAYQLLEMAAEELAALVLSVNPTLQELTLRLEKPGALPRRAQAASVQVRRRHSDYPVQRVQHGGVTCRRWLETRDSTLFLAQLEPGGAPLMPIARDARCLVLPLSSPLELDGQPLATDRASVLTAATGSLALDPVDPRVRAPRTEVRGLERRNASATPRLSVPPNAPGSGLVFCCACRTEAADAAALRDA